MENNETFVPEIGAENAGTTPAEERVEPPKLYTEDELNAKANEIAGKRTARREAKIRKEVEKEYRDLIDTLEAGTGKKGVKELNDSFTEFYQSRIKDFKVNKKPEYSERDIEVLAKAEADDIIRLGYDEVVEEVDRLMELGADNMSAKDKEVFRVLAAHRQNAEQSRELEKIGVTKDVYESQEFKDFAKMFTKDTPIQKVYKTYIATQPKKEFKTMGSMKQSAQDNGIKEYYTPDEAKKFTQAEINNNPELVKAIERSMRKWN